LRFFDGMGNPTNKRSRRQDADTAKRVEAENSVADESRSRVIRPESEKWTGRTPPEEIDPAEPAKLEIRHPPLDHIEGLTDNEAGG
jgi:hypothetical protein